MARACADGDCFVVAARDGQCWDGEKWVRLWSDAVQFRRPEPAYELCEQEAVRAEQLTGVKGFVAYIQPGTRTDKALSPFKDFSDFPTGPGQAVPALLAA